MSDKITEQEKQAIRAYVTGGGIVHRCPDGEAINARLRTIGGSGSDIRTFSDYLSELGLCVKPISPDSAKHLRRKENGGARYDVTKLLDAA